MNSKEYWGLMEAYSEVYAPDQLEESYVEEQRLSGQERRAQQASLRQQGGPLGQRRAAVQASGGPRGQGNNVLRRPGDPGRTSQPTTRIQRSPSTTATKPAPTPAAKPAPTPAAKPAPTSRPAATGPKASPAPTTSSASTTAAAPKRTFNPLMQKTFGYQTGYAPDQVKKDPKKMAQMGSLRSVTSGFDMFDLVKGHLLDEGYADTEEAAIAIMANMSEEWRENVIEEMLDEALTGDRYKKALKKGKMYSRMVSADPSKRAKRGGRGGESDFGVGDRGAGNKSRRRRGLPVGEED